MSTYSRETKVGVDEKAACVFVDESLSGGYVSKTPLVGDLAMGLCKGFAGEVIGAVGDAVDFGVDAASNLGDDTTFPGKFAVGYQRKIVGPDSDPLTYSKVGTTPFFMSVSASGLVTLAPGFSDAGSYTGTVRVSAFSVG